MLSFYESPHHEAAALRRAAARAGGCHVRAVRIGDTIAGPRAIGVIDCEDGWAAARLLLASAIEDARTPGARRLAAELRAGAPTDDAFARAIHRLVLERVRFEREIGEVFQNGSYTLQAGYGDCDDHARLAIAIALAGEMPAKLALLHWGGRTDRMPGPTHALAQLCPDGACAWAETTVAARYGEHPIAAARRVGVLKARADIADQVRIMTEHDLEHPEEAADADAQALHALGYDATDGGVRAFQARHGCAVDGILGPQTRSAVFSALNAAGLGELAMGYLGATTELAATKGASSRISDRFLRLVADMAERWGKEGASFSGKDLLLVLYSESGIKNIQNAQGYPAYGLNQLMNAPASGLHGFRMVGFTGGPQDYLALSIEDQFPFVERYFRATTRPSRMTNAADLYMVNFMPAHAGKPQSYVLAKADPNGPSPSAPEAEWAEWRASHRGDTYAANRGFDPERKGYIEIADVGRSLERLRAHKAHAAFLSDLFARYDAIAADPSAGSGPGLGTVAGAVAIVGAVAGWAYWQFA